tara:strand:- start:68 stop:2173 length:2106 start_codon:yes stop_codon:yes gene_type:complete
MNDVGKRTIEYIRLFFENEPIKIISSLVQKPTLINVFNNSQLPDKITNVLRDKKLPQALLEVHRFFELKESAHIIIDNKSPPENIVLLEDDHKEFLKLLKDANLNERQRYIHLNKQLHNQSWKIGKALLSIFYHEDRITRVEVESAIKGFYIVCDTVVKIAGSSRYIAHDYVTSIFTPLDSPRNRSEINPIFLILICMLCREKTDFYRMTALLDQMCDHNNNHLENLKGNTNSHEIFINGASRLSLRQDLWNRYINTIEPNTFEASVQINFLRWYYTNIKRLEGEQILDLAPDSLTANRIENLRNLYNLYKNRHDHSFGAFIREKRNLPNMDQEDSDQILILSDEWANKYPREQFPKKYQTRLNAFIKDTQNHIQSLYNQGNSKIEMFYGHDIVSALIVSIQIAAEQLNSNSINDSSSELLADALVKDKKFNDNPLYRALYMLMNVYGHFRPNEFINKINRLTDLTNVSHSEDHQLEANSISSDTMFLASVTSEFTGMELNNALKWINVSKQPSNANNQVSQPPRDNITPSENNSTLKKIINAIGNSYNPTDKSTKNLVRNVANSFKNDGAAGKPKDNIFKALISYVGPVALTAVCLSVFSATFLSLELSTSVAWSQLNIVLVSLGATIAVVSLIAAISYYHYFATGLDKDINYIKQFNPINSSSVSKNINNNMPEFYLSPTNEDAARPQQIPAQAADLRQ